MGKRLIVIGNGMVGLRFLEEWTKSEHHKSWDTVCFGEEPRPAYDRIHLSSYFTEPDAGALALVPAGWYREHGIDLRTGTKVARIDRQRHVVITDGGQEQTWDCLVIATGSTPYVPPFPGVDRAGVFLYRTIEDLDAIKAYSKRAKQAVVIGGGLLGLEAAKALCDLKLKTTIVEYSPRLMPRQIDQIGSDLLQQKLETLGVIIRTGMQTRSILGNGSVTGLEFAGSPEIAAQMVVISAGIRPRDDLALEAGLEVNERGGIVVDEYMRTSDPAIYAIGECANVGGVCFGLAAPGYRMAETAVRTILQTETKPFTGSDMSTKLKLMGVDVASIGDSVLGASHDEVSLMDSSSGTYKKLHIDRKTRTIAGAILVGDASDYSQLLQMYLNRIPLPEKPETLLVKGGGFTFGIKDLPDEAVICSCNNTTKGSIVAAVKGGVHKLEALKVCTRAGTGCGSCAGMVKDILNATLESQGIAVDKSICEHFAFTRQELFELIKIKGYQNFADLVQGHGHGLGCEICKPTAASIFASLYQEAATEQPALQDTNDRYMANIQKNGTYGIVPRMPAGEVTPAQLMAIAQVAQDYGLYTKVTGAQRIDLFGARLDDLPAIWQRLIDAGMESGQAYAKALRAVKSCVGSAWCRFGVQDSTSLAIELEQRYRGLRAPHKLKFGVSGCARECAEARGKDIGVIATEKGWNLYVCGNGGMNPRHAVLLARDIDKPTLFTYIDRFLMYYIRTADRLTRTAPWMEQLPGGIDKIKAVVVDDSLGLAAELELEMAKAVANYRDEWAATLADPVKLQRFHSFINSDQTDPTPQFIKVRGQIQPAPHLPIPQGVTQ